MTVVPFNPLDKRHLGESVGQAMLRQSTKPLGKLDKFQGAGIYAIYYTGPFKAYAPLAQHNKSFDYTAPIYVGKAAPKGARKGVDLDTPSTGSELYKRLDEHSKSIQSAENLDIEDFQCRFLVVEDIWIPLGESLLIAKFCPLWNRLIDGFGNHNPGSGRHKGMKPRWDVLHPGRGWAEKLAERNETPEQLTREITDYLKSNSVASNNDLITS